MKCPNCGKETDAGSLAGYLAKRLSEAVKSKEKHESLLRDFGGSIEAFCRWPRVKRARSRGIYTDDQLEDWRRQTVASWEAIIKRRKDQIAKWEGFIREHESNRID